jgi:hypothetical protein
MKFIEIKNKNKSKRTFKCRQTLFIQIIKNPNKRELFKMYKSINQ